METFGKLAAHGPSPLFVSRLADHLSIITTNLCWCLHIKRIFPQNLHSLQEYEHRRSSWRPCSVIPNQSMQFALNGSYILCQEIEMLCSSCALKYLDAPHTKILNLNPVFWFASLQGKGEPKIPFVPQNRDD